MFSFIREFLSRRIFSLLHAKLLGLTTTTISTMTKNGNSGRGNGTRSGGKGRGGSNSGNGSSNIKKGSNASQHEKGQVSALGTNVFDYGNKKCADQMRVTLEKIAGYIGTQFSNDMRNEIVNKKTVVIPEPSFDPAVQALHDQRVKDFENNKKLLLSAYDKEIKALNDAGSFVDAAKIQIKRQELRVSTSDSLEVMMSPTQKTKYDNEWKAWKDRMSRLELHRGKVFSLIEGQCTQSSVK